MELFQKVLVQVFGDATIILGIVALIGCLIQKKRGSDTILAVLKTMMGYQIISAGSSLMGSAMTPLIDLIYKTLNAQGVIQNTWPAYSAALTAYGTQVALVFLIGFIFNMILVRFTKLKGLALTVHLMLFVSTGLVAFSITSGISPVIAVIVCGLVAGLYFWLVTSFNAHIMKRLDMGTEYTIFVFCWWGFLISYLVKKIFKKDRDIDEIAFPKSLMWLKDTNGVLAVSMIILYFVFGIAAGIPAVQSLAGDQFWWLFILFRAIAFAVAIIIILYGVRMLISELVPAFAGIQQKLLPGAVPGLDYPTVFQFSSSAVMFGFIFNMVGSLLATLVMIWAKMPIVVIPGIQGQFFEGAVIGVFANRIGGVKNVIISNLIYGFITMFLLAVCIPFAGDLFTSIGGIYENCDYCLLGVGLNKLFSLFA